MAYSIFDFAGKARQVKERFQNCKNRKQQVNVSGLLVFCKLFFVVNLPYYESQPSFGDKGQASTFNGFINVYFPLPEQLKLLVKYILK